MSEFSLNLTVQIVSKMKRVAVLTVATVFALNAKAQFSINAGVDALKFTGDVGRDNNTNFFSDAKMGYNLGVDYRIGKVFDIGLNGIYGKLQGNDNQPGTHRNFMTQVYGGELNVAAIWDTRKDTLREFAPFISVGIGYLKFDPKGDLLDKNGVAYQYWTDGSIRNLPQSPANDPLAQPIRRDYKYETTLKDSSANYSRGTLYLPINIGAKFQMGFRYNLKVSVNYNIAFTDYLDNYKHGGNDSWLGARASLGILLAKKPKDQFSDVDFTPIDNADYDMDGVRDWDDDCQGTPKDVKVDRHGCPIDSDDDGIPDYLDKEPNTKRGNITDGDGVTVNIEDIARRQLEWDSLAFERNEGFNNQPSLGYLQQVETKAKDLQGKSGKVSKIPDELRSADLNKDGYISADEITKTIDGFFDGASDFTVEKINRLIDFFFEQ